MNIQLEPHVLTPYYYHVITALSGGCTDETTPNYSEYNLFCLKTRIRPLLESKINPKLSLEFIPVQRGETIYIGLRLTDAGERVELSSSQLRLLEEAVKEITSVDPLYCLLFSSQAQIRDLPSSWVLSVLPYLPVDPVVNPYVDQGHLYVDLSSYPDYNLRYTQMYDQIRATLVDYYARGGVICNATFAEEWQLAPYIILGREEISNEGESLGDQATTGLTDGNGLYFPTWADHRFAPDRVKFLLERMAGSNRVSIRLGFTPQRKAAVIKYLPPGTFLFRGGNLLLENVTSLEEIFDLLKEISVLPPDRVWISPIEPHQSLSFPPEQTFSDLSGASYLAVPSI